MALAAVLLVAGCTTSSGRPDAAACTSICRGTLAGAQYLIRMPSHWNGVLLINSHGYRSPSRPAAGRPALSIGDTTGAGTDLVSRTLLEQGYALAGSGAAEQGWSTQAALTAADELYRRFVQLHGTPTRTYAWGGSFGGLVTELLAERAEWVDGAAPLCGAVAGPLDNFDNFLEAAWATKVLLAPQLRVTGLASRTQVKDEVQLARTVISTAVVGGAGADGPAKVAYLATLLGLPAQSEQHPSGRPLAALADTLRSYVSFAIAIGYELDQRFGGNPAGTSAPPTPSAAVAAAVTTLGGDAAAYAASLAAAPAIAADPAARQAAQASGEPTGRLRVPTVTLHGEADPIAIVSNEKVLHDRVAAAGAGARLQQLYAAPAGPGSGIGHCVFTAPQVVATIDALDDWVRSGTRAPVPADLTADFSPAAWPEP